VIAVVSLASAAACAPPTAPDQSDQDAEKVGIDATGLAPRAYRTAFNPK
jgi:hypothetical protein